MISDHLNHLNHLKAFADFKSSAGFAKWFKLSFNVQKKNISFSVFLKINSLIQNQANLIS